MHVLIVSCAFPPEPMVSAQTSAQIAEELVHRGHEVTVVTPFPNRPAGKLFAGHKRRFVKRQIALEGFKLVRCFSFFSARSRMISRLMENLSFGLTSACVVLTTPRPDIIYSNTWPIVATGILSIVSRLRGIPMVISVQDMYPESLISQGRIGVHHWVARWMRWMDGIIARASQKVIVISESFAELYRRDRGLDSARLRVVANWTDSQLVTANDNQASTFRAAGNIPQNAFVILYGGNIGAAAGVDTLIRGFAQLKDVEDLYLIIAGAGSSLVSCRELAGELACSRILFHSPWQREETSMALAAADMLILPTSGLQSTASVPSKLISYMLSSRPVLASALPHSELAQVIESSQVGWVVEPDRPELLANKVREAMKMNSTELRRRGHLGRMYALANFTREVCLPKIVDLLENGVMPKSSLCERETAHQPSSV